MANPHTIALVGGTGFIGQAVLQQLQQHGCHVKLISRTPPRFTLPQHTSWHRATTAHPQSLVAHLTGCHTVVHLVATLAERGEPFTTTITQSAAHTVQAARHAGVKHVIYVSALGASATSGSRYARAKAQAEAAVRKVYPNATIFQPSLVLGQGGGFWQQLDNLTRYIPVLVLPGYGRSLFQPVAVDILAQHIATAARTPPSKAVTRPVVGAKVATFRTLAVQHLRHLKRRRLLLPLPWWLTWCTAFVLQTADTLTRHKLIPAWLLVTPDQVRLLTYPNILATSATIPAKPVRAKKRSRTA